MQLLIRLAFMISLISAVQFNEEDTKLTFEARKFLQVLADTTACPAEL